MDIIFYNFDNMRKLKTGFIGIFKDQLLSGDISNTSLKRNDDNALY